MNTQAKIEVVDVEAGEVFEFAWEDEILKVAYDHISGPYVLVVLRRGQ